MSATAPGDLRATIPAEPPVYVWEPSDAEVAAHYGIPVDSIVRFDTNTSPDEPRLDREQLAGPFEPPLNEYPDTSYRALTEAAATYVGARPEEIVVGAGADEVLDLVAKAFLPPGGRALLPSPTYGMYRVLTAQRGAESVPVPRRGPEAGFALDADAVVRAAATCDLVWCCWPNNPTGTAEPLDDMVALLDRLAALPDGGPLVVVDEAYHEFLGATLVDERSRHPRLVVVRTLSKAFGLAGIRVGFAVATPPTAARLARVRPPGSISTISATIAAAALAHPDLAAARAAGLRDERDWLAAGLRAVGWTVEPSVANFLLVRPAGGSAAGDPGAAVGATAGSGAAAGADAAGAAADALLRAGCVPRTFDPGGPLAGCLRLTVRSRAENERLLAAVRSADVGAPTEEIR